MCLIAVWFKMTVHQICVWPEISANEQNHHHVDVDCKLDDSHHGDQDDQDVDQNDDKQDPICIEDDVDDDDENDNHQAISIFKMMM